MDTNESSQKRLYLLQDDDTPDQDDTSTSTDLEVSECSVDSNDSKLCFTRFLSEKRQTSGPVENSRDAKRSGESRSLSFNRERGDTKATKKNGFAYSFMGSTRSLEARMNKQVMMKTKSGRFVRRYPRENSERLF